ncbi:EamA family transporter [Psychroflexus salis]|uniref:EamA domain-containing protein n=1 Tax=Psychroflexus salis TaxID=1526574 RepID=A0A916ZWG5_9FLAO|nr:EamA family transporter [Psychroflexus salis]GGE16988.1 hypothetical protein GCM10010831_17850 [Psychroflexus salis]
MIYLALSILSSSLIYLVFKLLGKFQVKTLHALIFNYITAFLIGLGTHSNEFQLHRIFEKEWFYGSLILGFLFIVVFSLMVKTTQELGMSVVSVASKMSVAIPVLFVIWYYNEPLNHYKIAGIALALVAVLLVSIKKKTNIKLGLFSVLLPFLVFFGSGIIETSIKFLEQDYVSHTDVGNFSLVIFFFAACFGFLFWFFKSLKAKSSDRFQFKEILGGIALGIPNFYSIFFFISALKSEVFPSSLLFVVNNVSIVVLSTLLGIVFFKEKLTVKNWIGIAVAVASIALIYFTSDLIVA